MVKKKEITNETLEDDSVNKEIQKLCGIVMPISSIDGCSEKHWLEVKEIITTSLSKVGFKSNLVSASDDVGIIQKRIIQNLYDNPIVVCDVSGKNPNVMFELGMRLAFDKPTVIIKDDATSYSFDTSPIEHLEYPRDLRYSKILEFKQELAEKVLATLEKSSEDPEYTTFLKHFGTFTVSKLDKKEITKEDYILEEIKEIKRDLQYQKKQKSIVPPDYLFSQHTRARPHLDKAIYALYKDELKKQGYINPEKFKKEAYDKISQNKPLTDKFLNDVHFNDCFDMSFREIISDGIDIDEISFDS